MRYILSLFLTVCVLVNGALAKEHEELKVGFIDLARILSKSHIWGPEVYARSCNKIEDVYLHLWLPLSRDIADADDSFTEAVSQQVSELSKIRISGADKIRRLVEKARTASGVDFGLILSENGLLYSRKFSCIGPENDLTVEVEIIINHRSVHQPRPRQYKPLLLAGRTALVDLAGLQSDLAAPRSEDVIRDLSGNGHSQLSRRAVDAIMQLRKEEFRWTNLQEEISPESYDWGGLPLGATPDKAMNQKIRNAIHTIAQAKNYDAVVDVNSIFYGQSTLIAKSDDITETVRSFVQNQL